MASVAVLQAATEMHPFERWRQEPVLSPTSVKRQHYFPRMALKHFARADGSVRFVNIGTGRAGFAPSVGSAGYRNGYFDVETLEGVTDSTETWLSDCENIAAPLIGRIVEDHEVALRMSPEEERAFARFVAGLRFRSPAFRGELSKVRQAEESWTRDMFERWLAAHPEFTAEQRDEWRRADASWFLSPEMTKPDSLIVAEHLAEVDDYASLLIGMDWTVGPASELFTSDNPVAGAYLRRPSGPGGFADMTYFVPLSPNVLFRATPNRSGPTSGPGLRRTRDWTRYDVAVASVCQVADAEEFLYGDFAPNSRSQKEARGEVFRMMTAAGNQNLLDAGGDPYSKIGFRGVTKFLTPDDPDWYDRGLPTPPGFKPLGSARAKSIRSHRHRG